MIEAIKTRLSIRKYKDLPVEKEKLQAMLEAALRAPSARHAYPSRFVVFTDQETIDQIAAFDAKVYAFKTAKAGILVSYDSEATRSEFGYIDTSAAIENMLLEAKELGLDTCWHAVLPIKERADFVRALFKLPENHEPVALISIGYSDEDKEVPDHYKEEYISWWK